MSNGKRYGGPEEYEDKLKRVMQRFGAEEYNFDWGRSGGWVEFRINGVLYRFDHSVEKAQDNGQKLKYGSDAFAQLVLALEDLARLAERGIYKLQTWIEGMRFLPPAVEVPESLRELGFDRIPDAGELAERWKTLAKQYHPDAPGGSNEMFVKLQKAMENAKRLMEAKAHG